MELVKGLVHPGSTERLSAKAASELPFLLNTEAARSMKKHHRMY